MLVSSAGFITHLVACVCKCMTLKKQDHGFIYPLVTFREIDYLDYLLRNNEEAYYVVANKLYETRAGLGQSYISIKCDPKSPKSQESFLWDKLQFSAWQKCWRFCSWGGKREDMDKTFLAITGVDKTYREHINRGRKIFQLQYKEQLIFPF